MPAQWFFAPFVRRDNDGEPGRYCMVDDLTGQINADGGAWAEFECGGGPGTSYLCGVAGVKVGGVTDSTLTAVDALSGVLAVPTKLLELETSMSVTTNAEKAFIRDQVGRELGYSDAEIAAWLGVAVGASTNQKNQALNTKTFGQFLEFLATRWYSPVYDPAGSQVGYLGQTYPGVVACDGRTVAATGVTSTLVSPTPVTPAQVAASIPST